jgi:hypothetical protein
MVRAGWWAKKTPYGGRRPVRRSSSVAAAVVRVDAAVWKCERVECRSIDEERNRISCHSETAMRRVSQRDFTGATTNIENDTTRSNQMDDGVVRNGTNSSSEK